MILIILTPGKLMKHFIYTPLQLSVNKHMWTSKNPVIKLTGGSSACQKSWISRKSIKLNKSSYINQKITAIFWMNAMLFEFISYPDRWATAFIEH